MPAAPSSQRRMLRSPRAASTASAAARLPVPRSSAYSAEVGHSPRTKASQRPSGDGRGAKPSARSGPSDTRKPEPGSSAESVDSGPGTPYSRYRPPWCHAASNRSPLGRPNRLLDEVDLELLGFRLSRAAFPAPTAARYHKAHTHQQGLDPATNSYIRRTTHGIPFPRSYRITLRGGDASSGPLSSRPDLRNARDSQVRPRSPPSVVVPG